MKEGRSSGARAPQDFKREGLPVDLPSDATGSGGAWQNQGLLRAAGYLC